jgi:hypothetical protein
MATFHGRSGQVFIGANQVAEVNEFSVELTAEYAEDTNMNDQDKTSHADPIRSGTGTMTCWWDDTDATGQELLNVGESATLLLRPEGTGSGLNQLSFTARVTNEGITVRKGEIVSRTVAFLISGAVNRATQ